MSIYPKVESTQREPGKYITPVSIHPLLTHTPSFFQQLKAMASRSWLKITSERKWREFIDMVFLIEKERECIFISTTYILVQLLVVSGFRSTSRSVFLSFQKKGKDLRGRKEILARFPQNGWSFTFKTKLDIINRGIAEERSLSVSKEIKHFS